MINRCKCGQESWMTESRACTTEGKDAFGRTHRLIGECDTVTELPDTDAEFRKDHAQAAKFAIDISVTNYLKLLRVPNEGCAKCIDEVRSVLRNYEPS